MADLHGCGDQPPHDPKGPFHAVKVAYDIGEDRFCIQGHDDKRLWLPREIRLDRIECGTDVMRG